MDLYKLIKHTCLERYTIKTLIVRASEPGRCNGWGYVR